MFTVNFFKNQTGMFIHTVYCIIYLPNRTKFIVFSPVTVASTYPMLYSTDSRTLCGTKDEAGQAAMLKDLKALCEASKELCDGSVQQEASSNQLYHHYARAQFCMTNGVTCVVIAIILGHFEKTRN